MNAQSVIGQGIIPYQEIIGNYSRSHLYHSSAAIIPYQEIIGNYSPFGVQFDNNELYHTKK